MPRRSNWVFLHPTAPGIYLGALVNEHFPCEPFGGGKKPAISPAKRGDSHCFAGAFPPLAG
jgi:hypothetical protein